MTAACIDADGWSATGDLGSVDADGYLTLAGRAKELIIRNGLNVYPAEIEAVLSEHHDVLLAAVVGVRDDAVGEEIAALVVLREGASTDARDRQDFMREHVAAYKHPRVIQVVDALPLGPTGKVLKRSIDVDKSGKVFKTPLDALVEDHERGEIVIGPMWGKDADWYRNVVAGGLVEVHVRGEQWQVEWQELDEAGAVRRWTPIARHTVSTAG